LGKNKDIKKEMGNGGSTPPQPTVTNVEYSVNFNTTLINLINYSVSGGYYSLPDGSWANSRTLFRYTQNGSQKLEYADTWRSKENVPFSFGGDFRLSSSNGWYIKTNTSVDSGNVRIRGIQYRSLYEGGYSSNWQYALNNSGIEYTLPKSYYANGYDRKIVGFGIYVEYEY
ncbi:Hypothetical protein ORPV_697, partial [Orpheovirus IHUMI-LCC2]